jgi:hypothetical protein
MIQFFADMIDSVVTAFDRLMELPVFALFFVFLIPFAGLVALAWLIGRKTGMAIITKPRVKILLVAFSVFMLFVLLDCKEHALMEEVREINVKMSMTQSGSVDSVKGEPERPLFNRDRVRKGLESLFPKYAMSVEYQDRAVDFAQVRVPSPDEKQIYVAVIDLTDPDLRVRITPDFREKWLTSDFAKKYDCIVAINGEAGNSPALKSGLGDYAGNWIVEGKAVLLKDTARRPFMAFDQLNKPLYSPAEKVDAVLSPDKFNAIWGRVDLLVDGVVVPKDQTRYSRTIMGIDKQGERLILMVVDAQRPGHSLGISLPDAGRVMALFGAYNAMACDQGGSTCMYLKSRNGIVSRPSDGKERPVYSHFGISRIQ